MFSQVNVITKISNSMIFKFFELMEYFDHVIKMYYSMIFIQCEYKISVKVVKYKQDLFLFIFGKRNNKAFQGLKMMFA